MSGTLRMIAEPLGDAGDEWSAPWPATGPAPRAPLTPPTATPASIALPDVDGVMQEIIRAYPEPALVVDRHGQCRWVNAAAGLALGLVPERSVGLDLQSLGLPAPVVAEVGAVVRARRDAIGAERQVICHQGAGGARRFTVTVHQYTREVLVTWSDFVGAQEAARQVANLSDFLRTLHERSLADGRRRQERLARLGAEVHAATVALRSVGIALAAEDWELAPGRSAPEVLAEEARRLRAVLDELAQLGRELSTAPPVADGDYREL